MHPRSRRAPAERARHAKRLGHAQPGELLPQILAAAAPTTTTSTTQHTTTTSSDHVTTTTSSIPSSSSAPSLSSATSSASSIPSSATSSPTSIPQSLTDPGQSPSLVTPSVVATPTSLATPTATSQPNAATTSKGLSGGALSGIIAGAVIVGVALIVFFVRKTYLRRREREHISWNEDPRLPDILDEPKPLSDVSDRPVSFNNVPNTPQRNVPLSPFDAHGQSMYSLPVVHMQPPTIPNYGVPTPPPATYNNPTPVAAYPPHPVASAYNPGNTAAFAMARTGLGTSSIPPFVHPQHAPLEAIVKCTFVPTLPDELSITTGERIFIVDQYDDGWDLCTNARGERGMVPRECLEQAPIEQPDLGWRNVRRTSSLNPDGRRF